MSSVIYKMTNKHDSVGGKNNGQVGRETVSKCLAISHESQNKAVNDA